MAIKSLQITQTGSAVQFSATAVYANWVVIQNMAAAVARVGDASVTTSKGFSVVNGGTNPLVLPVLPAGKTYNLSDFWTIGTNTQLLDVLYDSVNS